MLGYWKRYIQVPNWFQRETNDTKSDVINCQFNLWPTWICGFFYLKRQKTTSAALSSWDRLGWESRWFHNQWIANMTEELERLRMSWNQQVFKPSGFGKIKEFWLHHFPDASKEGYGKVSYLWMVNTDEIIHCCFLEGKARVTPKKFVSIPCLELVAAVLSVKVAIFLKKTVENWLLSLNILVWQ